MDLKIKLSNKDKKKYLMFKKLLWALPTVGGGLGALDYPLNPYMKFPPTSVSLYFATTWYSTGRISPHTYMYSKTSTSQ